MLICILAFHFVLRQNFLTQHFYKKRYFINKASVALNPLVSLIGRLVLRSGRKRGNRQTDRQTDRQYDKTTTVTLAAHARRGLIRRHIRKAGITHYTITHYTNSSNSQLAGHARTHNGIDLINRLRPAGRGHIPHISKW